MLFILDPSALDTKQVKTFNRLQRIKKFKKKNSQHNRTGQFTQKITEKASDKANEKEPIPMSDHTSLNLI